MKPKYLPKQFESKWIKQWDKEHVYQTGNDPKKKKQYILVMFPYPSGDGLHVGHARVYTGTDVLARYYRMNNTNVLHPMGWDAFGLPAENAAIKKKVNPMDIVPRNIQTFKKQMKMLGLSYDWSRELTTTDPNYYRWTQWLFIQFFKMGLLYKKNTPIHFCPKCKTGLAEEEVLANGTHERCGHVIEKRELPQWMFRITAYADRLLKDLTNLDWPRGILEMQRNWIGRKQGIKIKYQLIDFDYEIECFTTRPDTNFGATFIVIAPEHDFVKKIIAGEISSKETDVQAIKKYIRETNSKTEMDRLAEGRKKTGIVTGFYALNKLNGRKMPIWISDFVLSGFGTGAIVGVPGHDVRDFEFAKEFGLHIIRVVVGKDGDTSEITRKEQVQEGEGIMMNSDFLNGLETREAIKKMMDYIEEKGMGIREVTYHLRDWIFSRQRYWGEPIPMIYCETCAKNNISYHSLCNSCECGDQCVCTDSQGQLRQASVNKVRKTERQDSVEKQGWSKMITDDACYGWFPMKEEDLPLELPYVKSYEPTGIGASPLATIESFVNTKCPHCGGPAKRETDTMPNWAGSCWYFLAFTFRDELLNTKHRISNFSENWKLNIRNYGNKFLPVDWYIGGAEHAVLHLLYSRFWVKAMQDLGLVDFSEPFLKLRNVGMVLAEDHRKMSKSLGNVINPDDVISEYGADAIRVYEMFMAPFNAEIPWSVRTLQGTYRFMVRIWQIYHDSDKITDDEKDESKELVIKLQKVIQKVSSDITDVKFNTCISSMMEFINEWEGIKTQSVNFVDSIQRQNQQSANTSSFFGTPGEKPRKFATSNHHKLLKTNAKKFLQILAPFAPFITEEIWRNVFGEKTSIHVSIWPTIDKTLLQDERVTIAVQVNGKVRGTISLTRGEKKDKNMVVKKALAVEKVAKYVADTKYKVIYIEGRILNFILD